MNIHNLYKKIRQCRKCEELKNSRTQPVIGCGSIPAKILIVGEAPSQKGSDKTGKPFMGDKSGELLNSFLLQVKECIFITNIVKCCPPHNRTPLPREVQNCVPFLEEELMIIKPTLIISLGKLATGYFLQRNFGIRKFKMKEYHSVYLEGYCFDLLPLYHPAFVIKGGITKALYEKVFFEGLKKFNQRDDK